MKALVIDDEPLIRELLVEFLKILGHEADAAVDGYEALARFDPLVHELVITDLLMPGLTGLEVAEAIRARSHTMPIVMISGQAEPDDQQRAIQAGLRFLRKPVSLAQFAAAIADVVEPAAAAR